MAALQDALTGTSLDTTIWTEFTAVGGTTSYSTTGATMNYSNPTSTSNDADIASVGTYDLTGSFARLNVVNVPQGANSDATFKLRAGSNLNDLHWQNEGTNLFAAYIVGGSQTILKTLTYNATNHAWWQIREKGGTIYWETSVDGITWTTQATVATPITITSLTANMAATSFGVDANLTGFKFRYFNYPLPGTTTSTSSTSISSTSSSTSSTSISTSSTSISSTSASTSTSSTSTSISSTSSSTSSTSSSTSSTSTSSTSSSTSISSTSVSLSSTSTSSTSLSSTSSSTSLSSTSSSISSISSSTSSTSSSVSSTSFSSTSSSSSTSTTTLPPPYLTYSYKDFYNNIVATNLDINSSTVAGLAFTTDSITPAPNTLIICWVASNHAASGTLIPTSLTGNGLTWVNFASQTNALGSGAVSGWRAMGQAPTSGQITINWDASTSYCGWSVVQYANVDTSGTNGSGALGQTAGNTAVAGESNATTTQLYNSATNGVAAFIRNANNQVISPLNGLVMTGQQQATGATQSIGSGFSNASVAAPGFSWQTSLTNLALISAEINAAPSDTNANLNLLNASQYSNLNGDDGDYFITTGSKYVIQEFKKQNANNTSNISITWKGRTTLSTRTSPLYLQIYNLTTAAWETLNTQTLVPADTDFSISGTQSTNLSNYYDSTFIASFRIYQQVN